LVYFDCCRDYFCRGSSIPLVAVSVVSAIMQLSFVFFIWAVMIAACLSWRVSKVSTTWHLNSRPGKVGLVANSNLVATLTHSPFLVGRQRCRRIYVCCNVNNEIKYDHKNISDIVNNNKTASVNANERDCSSTEFKGDQSMDSTAHLQTVPTNGSTVNTTMTEPLNLIEQALEVELSKELASLKSNLTTKRMKLNQLRDKTFESGKSGFYMVKQQVHNFLVIFYSSCLVHFKVCVD
jgi:hypothetical protein